MSTQRTLSIFGFIDAYGWRIANRYPILEGELSTRRPLETVFGYSSSCDPTILTGKMPNEHGHFTFYQYAPERSPFRGFQLLSLLPKQITSRGRLRHWLSRLVQHRLGYTGYFQLYNVPFDLLPLLDYSEKRDLYQPGGIINGTDTVFDQLRQRKIPFSLSNWRKSETENVTHLLQDLDQGEVEFAYLYLADLDSIMHREGTCSSSIRAKTQWYDARLREVLAAARRRYDKVQLHLFSDHGMTDVVQHVDLISQVEALGLSYGKDYAAIYDSTIARFYFLNQRAKSRICDLLATQSAGQMLSDDWLRAARVYFPDHAYGDLFFLFDPGVLCVPSFMGERGVAGMHGYDPQHEDSTACFASTEEFTQAPRRLTDLYGLMCDAFGKNEAVANDREANASATEGAPSA